MPTRKTAWGNALKFTAQMEYHRRNALQWCRRIRHKATELQHEIKLGVASGRYSNRAVTLIEQSPLKEFKRSARN